MTETLIDLENACKVYQLGSNQLSALNGINIKIHRGQAAAIVGVSGSGKSTLMNIIGFLDRLTSGKYYFAGKDVSHLTEDELAHIRNHKIGFVFQSFFLLARSTALQNVMLPLFYRGTSRYEAKEKAYEMLEKVGVVKYAKHLPNQLSGGQQQRVAIARALIGDPDLILADEPTGALDSQTSQEVMQLFLDLNEKEGRTIVIITHDKEISRRLPHVFTIKDGKLI